MPRERIGHFELVVLLTLMRLGGEAYGVPIAQEIESGTKRRVVFSSLYASLERLRDKGWVTSRVGEPTAERGGKAKKFYRITGAGEREARAAKRELEALWRGVPALQGSRA